MKSAFVVQWSGAIPGRELLALEYIKEVSDFWGKLAAEGKCSPETMLMDPEGAGIWFVTGETSDLSELIGSEGSQRLNAKGCLLVRDFRGGLFTIGAGLKAQLDLFKEVATEMGLGTHV